MYLRVHPYAEPQGSPKSGHIGSAERPAIAKSGTLTPRGALIGSLGMSNVLSDEKKQQVIALGKLGWSLRRIEEVTGVRRETASAYLKTAGVVVCLPGWGRRAPAKPAIQVTPDSWGKTGHSDPRLYCAFFTKTGRFE